MRVEIRELDRNEIDAILGRNHTGRIAFSSHDRVDSRAVIPEAFTPEDPVPFRDIVFRIPVQEVVDQASSSTAE